MLHYLYIVLSIITLPYIITSQFVPITDLDIQIDILSNVDPSQQQSLSGSSLTPPVIQSLHDDTIPATLRFAPFSPNTHSSLNHPKQQKPPRVFREQHRDQQVTPFYGDTITVSFHLFDSQTLFKYELTAHNMGITPNSILVIEGDHDGINNAHTDYHMHGVTYYSTHDVNGNRNPLMITILGPGDFSGQLEYNGELYILQSSAITLDSHKHDSSNIGAIQTAARHSTLKVVHDSTSSSSPSSSSSLFHLRSLAPSTSLPTSTGDHHHNNNNNNNNNNESSPNHNHNPKAFQPLSPVEEGSGEDSKLATDMHPHPKFIAIATSEVDMAPFSCGSLDPPHTGDAGEHNDHDHNNDNNNNNDHDHDQLHQHTHVTAPPSPSPTATTTTTTKTTGKGPQRFTNCIIPDVQSSSNIYGIDQRFSIGVVVDYTSFVAMDKNIGLIVARVLHALAYANRIYHTQLGIILTIDTLTVMTTCTGGENPEWNLCPDSAIKQGLTPNQLLNNFSAWRHATYPSSFGVAVLITNNFPPPGVVGLAWTTMVGMSYYGSTWVNLNAYFPLTFAHEILHVFGASHTMGKGEGSIMSYDLSGRIGITDIPQNHGEVGIHSKITKPLVCRHLTNVKLRKSVQHGNNYRIPLDQIFSEFSGSVCGNNIVELGEECDNDSPCCTSDCKLTPGATCSIPSECCIDCIAQPSTTTCGIDRNQGYCSRGGQCHPSGCFAVSGTQRCHINQENNCQEYCKKSFEKECYLLDRYLSDYPMGTTCQLKNGKTKTKQHGGVCMYKDYPYNTAQYPIPYEHNLPDGLTITCEPITYNWASMYLEPEQLDNLSSLIPSYFEPCQCNAQQQLKLFCYQNNITIVSASFCEGIPKPLDGIVSRPCRPPSYCKI